MKSDSIQLIPVGQSVGPLSWQMSMNNGPAHGSNDYPVVTVGYSEQDDITYTIRHPGSIRFAKTNAFCAQAGTTKPTTNCDTAFTYTGGGTTTLVVHDSNPVKADYNYVINFNDNVPQLDPIIKNGGGGTGFSFDSFLRTTTGEIVAAVAVILVIALIVWAISSRRNAE